MQKGIEETPKLSANKKEQKLACSATEIMNVDSGARKPVLKLHHVLPV